MKLPQQFTPLILNHKATTISHGPNWIFSKQTINDKSMIVAMKLTTLEIIKGL